MSYCLDFLIQFMSTFFFRVRKCSTLYFEAYYSEEI